MEQFLDNLRTLDRTAFFSLVELARYNHFWREFFHFFADYGIMITFLGIIYLILRNRVNAVFAAFLAMIMSFFATFIVYLFWQRPRPYITYAGVGPLAGYTSPVSFPSTHTFLTFAIATVILLYGHKKLGVLLLLVAILIAVSRIATGVHYPSDVIGGALIGIGAGIFSFWTMESFEKFWENNSAA